MSTAMIVAAREIRARKLIFLTAPAWGVLVAVLGSIHHDRNAVITAAAICALVFGVVMSLVVGSALVGRELAERRLSFYFARPIPAASIWGGKYVGGLAVVIASQVLVLAPSLIAFRVVGDDAISIAVVLALPIALLALGMVVGIALRSKSLWVASDLCVLVGTGFLIRWGWAILDDALAISDFLLKPLIVGGCLVAIVLVVGSAAAVMVGRCDIKRAHRAAALVVLVLVPAGFGGVAWAHWYVTPSGHDLRGGLGAVSPDARWGLFYGAARGRGFNVTFQRFVDLTTFRAVDPGAAAGIDPAFSADGRTVAWIARRDLMTLALDQPNSQPIRSRSLSFVLPGTVGLSLSPNGDRIVVGELSTVSVYSLPDERPLAVIPSENGTLTAVRYLSPSRIRLYRTVQHDRVRIDEIEMGGKPQKTGEVELASFHRLSSEGDRILGHDGVFDGRTGERLATPPPFVDAAFLDDGRIVLVEADGTLRVLSKSMQVERSLPLGAPASAITGQPSDHEVVVTTRQGTMIADFGANSVRVVPDRMAPAVPYVFTKGRAARFFYNAAADLVEYDGSVHTLIHGRP